LLQRRIERLLLRGVELTVCVFEVRDLRCDRRAVVRRRVVDRGRRRRGV